MKKYISVLIVFILLLGSCVIVNAEGNNFTISVDGKSLEFNEEKPILNKDSRIMVSDSFIENNLACKVFKNQNNQSLVIQNTDREIKIKLGEKQAELVDLKSNESSIKAFDSKAIELDGKYYVPLRFISEALGLRIYWDPQANNANIALNKKTETTVFVIGDSTACNYTADRAPRAGWGQVINQIFNDKVTIRNMARSGRSSKSFIEEGHFNGFLDDIKKGDYVFIQFGHNDEKKEDVKRYTEPYSTFKSYLSVYIDEVQKRGAIPILVTPVSRNTMDNNGKVLPNHGEYPDAMIQLAAEKKISVIDLTAKSMALFESLGKEKTYNLFLNYEKGENPNYPNGVNDDTHFKDVGALEIAKLITEGIKENKLPLENYIK